MPTAPHERLTRRMIWSVSASITLLFLTSTSTLPSVPVPPNEYSLGLETIFARTGLGLAAARVAPARVVVHDLPAPVVGPVELLLAVP